MQTMNLLENKDKNNILNQNSAVKTLEENITIIELKKGSFRLQTKKLFLTYSQIDDKLTKEDFLAQLTRKLNRWNVINYLIAFEKHEDSGTHCHVVIVLKKRCDIKNQHQLNLIDSNNKVFRGNYQAVKSIYAAITYALKDGDFITNFELDENNKQLMVLETKLLELAKSSGLGAAMDLYLKSVGDRVGLHSFSRVKNNLKTYLQTIKPQNTGYSKYTIEDYAPHTELNALISNIKNEVKSLWVYGDSGTRKTSYVCAFLVKLREEGLIKGFLFVRDKDHIKDFDPELHDVIVCDDIRFPTNRENFISLVDSEHKTAINVKYDVLAIPENVRRIIISNFSLNEIIQKLGFDRTAALYNRVIEIYIQTAILIKSEININLNINNNFNKCKITKFNNIQNKVDDEDDFITG